MVKDIVEANNKAMILIFGFNCGFKGANLHH